MEKIVTLEEALKRIAELEKRECHTSGRIGIL